jgi:hypothetical protein
MISLLSIDANAPLIAIEFSMRRGTGKGNDLHFHLNRKERPSAPRRSHVRAEQSVTSVMVIRRLGVRTAN